MFNKNAINELTKQVEELTRQINEIRSKVDVKHYNRDLCFSETAPVNTVVGKLLEHFGLNLITTLPRERSCELIKMNPLSEQPKGN